MKKIFILFFLSFLCNYSFGQVTWSTPIQVASGSTYGNLHPRVVLNRAGNPIVLWGKTDTKAYCSRWTGSAFSMPAAVNNSGIDVFAQSWAGPDIAAHGDTVYVVMKRTPETSNLNHIYLCRSFNGGATFSDTIRVDNIDTSLSRFPIVTTTSAGNPLVAFMKFNTMFTDAKYVVSRSADYGTTFSADALASGTAGDVCDCCPASVISSGSTAVMLFRNNLGNIRDIWAGVSLDNGATFASNFPADTTNWMIMSCPSSGPDGIVIGDSVYSVFMSSSSGTALVHFSRASVSAASARHSAITGLFSGLSSQNYPRMANAGAEAVAVWKQNSSAGNAIVYSFTNNITGGFSGYSTLTGATGSGVMNADVAMEPGAIHIVWEDDNTGNVMYTKGTYTSAGMGREPVKSSLELYPNPATNSVSVSLKKIGKISGCYLSDIAGRHIELAPVETGDIATFSLSAIARGGYYLVITNSAGDKYYSKLIVQ